MIFTSRNFFIKSQPDVGKFNNLVRERHNLAPNIHYGKKHCTHSNLMNTVPSARVRLPTSIIFIARRVSTCIMLKSDGKTLRRQLNEGNEE